MAKFAGNPTQMIMDLLDYGFACSCGTWVLTAENDIVLAHDGNTCEAQETILALVNGVNLIRKKYGVSPVGKK